MVVSWQISIEWQGSSDRSTLLQNKWLGIFLHMSMNMFNWHDWNVDLKIMKMFNWHDWYVDLKNNENV